MLSAAGVTKVDDFTISFKLDTPTASFPYLTSSTTYQAIILPKDYAGPYEKTPQTTGAFNLVAYTPGVSAKYDRNPNWWGGSAPLDGVDVTLGEDTAIINALIGGQLDLLNGIVFANSRALFNNPNVKILKAQGATHRQIPMRVDTAPFKDKRVRQAIALTLDRPQISKTLFNDLADLGNESPFAPVYPSSVKVAQRHKDIAKAKQLIAGRRPLEAGFKSKLVTYQTAELPQLAQIVKQAVKAIGMNLDVKILTGTQYYSGTPTHDAVAERADDDHRLGPPRRAQRAAQRGAHEQGRAEQEGRHLERGALQEQEVRRPREVVRRGHRARRPAQVREADRAAAP